MIIIAIGYIDWMKIRSLCLGYRRSRKLTVIPVKNSVMIRKVLSNGDNKGALVPRTVSMAIKSWLFNFN